MAASSLQHLTQRVQTHPLIRWTVRTVSERGRLLAVVILLWSCLMLLSDWPLWWPRLPKPVAEMAQSMSGSFPGRGTGWRP